MAGLKKMFESIELSGPVPLTKESITAFREVYEGSESNEHRRARRWGYFRKSVGLAQTLYPLDAEDPFTPDERKAIVLGRNHATTPVTGQTLVAFSHIVIVGGGPEVAQRLRRAHVHAVVACGEAVYAAASPIVHPGTSYVVDDAFLRRLQAAQVSDDDRRTFDFLHESHRRTEADLTQQHIERQRGQDGPRTRPVMYERRNRARVYGLDRPAPGSRDRDRGL